MLPGIKVENQAVILNYSKENGMSYKARLCLVSSMLGMFLTTQAGAVGSNGLNVQIGSVRAMGMGNAFVGLADDPTANYLNPAGLTQLEGWQTTLGVTPVLLQSKYTSNSGNADKIEYALPVVPNIYFTGLLSDHWSMGLGVTAPYGLGTEWSKTSAVRYVATKSELVVLHYNPNLAYKVSDRLSFAAGVDYFDVPKAKLDSQVDQRAFGDADGTKRLEGDGGAWGYNIATLWKPTEKHSFGMSYRSQAKVRLKGNVKLFNMGATLRGSGSLPGPNYSVPVETIIPFAQNIILGYSFRPNEKWTFLFDYEWNDWSVFDRLSLNIKESDPTRSAFLNNDNPQNKSWKDSHAYAVGTEYSLPNKVKLRAGYSYFPSVIPEATWDPSLPEADVHNVCFGLGLPVKSVIVDFSYFSDIYEKRKVNSSVGESWQIPTTVDGTYRSISYVFGVSATYKF